MIHVIRCPEEDLKKVLWWQVFKVSQKSLVFDGSFDEVRVDVLRKFRFWSRFVHPDNIQNQNHGIYVQDLLATRFILLNESKESMLKWYEGAKFRANKGKKKKRGAQSYKKRGRTIHEDSEHEVIEIL